MTNDPSRAARAHAILSEVLDAAPERRGAMLDERCAGDPALRQWIEEMVRADSTAHELLDSSPAAFAPLLEADDEASAGLRIGPYRVVREIGRGGMGVVYLAERDDGEFQQRVALKLVRSGPDADTLADRFLRERQILANLKHPNIAQLLDGGRSPEGQPFLAMEHVDGERIDRYCERQKLGIEQRLRLFLIVCQAVQYAHQNLVVHRDLKPANVLVTADGVVKLLDFGIAKLLPAGPGVAPDETQTRAHAFTPRYSSPEQIRHRPITTASDVYALGVILFELLTGSTPFGDRGAPYEAARATVEEEPPPPSSKLDGERRRRVRGDLDAIVLRALRKDPAERYATAATLADDVRRWLRREPVSARPDSAAYRVRMFVRRNRGPVAAAAGVVLLLGTLGAYHTNRITSERNRAELEARKASEVRDFLYGMFTISQPNESLGDTLRVRDLLERGVASADSLEDQPELRALVLTMLGDVYRVLGRYDRASPLLEEALALYRGLPDADPLGLAGALTSTANIHFDLRRYQDALPPTREALEIQRRELGEDDPEVVLSLANLATLTARLGDADEALRLHQQILERRRRLLGPDDPSVGITLNNIGHLFFQQERYPEAERYFREALDLRIRIHPPTHPDVLLAMSNLATVYRELDRLDEAEPLYRNALELRQQVLGPEHPQVAISHYGLAQLLKLTGNLAGAEEHFRAALEIDRRTYGPDHSEVAIDSYQLALVLAELGRCPDAEPLLRDAIRIFEQDAEARARQLELSRSALADCRPDTP